MIKKFIFIMSVILFGFNTVAEMNSGQGVDHMSDMMQSGSSETEESNLIGAVELKYKLHGFSEGTQYPSYRARIGWKGEVTEGLTWKVSFTSSRDERLFPSKKDSDPAQNPFPLVPPVPAEVVPQEVQPEEVQEAAAAGHVLPGAYLEQAYVAYSPVEGFVIKAGQFGWTPKFHKTGVLYDDDVYSKGVLVKYYNGNDAGRFYGKVLLQNNPFYELSAEAPETILKAKLGGKYAFSSDFHGGAYVVADYDNLFGNTGDTSNSTAQLGINLSAPGMAVPVGVFGTWMTSFQDFGFQSFTAGAYAGQAGAPTTGEQGDFGVAISYYKVNQNDFRTYFMDTDYVTQASGDGFYHGFAARLQYNIWDKVNLVVKYAHELDVEKDGNNLVGELTFNL